MIKQPVRYKPKKGQIGLIKKHIPKSCLDLGASISLVALGYAVWTNSNKKGGNLFDGGGGGGGGLGEVGLRCHRVIRKTKIKNGRFFKHRLNKIRCGAKIILSTTTPLNGNKFNKITFLYSRKHTTNIIVKA